MMLKFADPKEWWLELPPIAQATAVQRSQQYSRGERRHTAYLNELCLSVFLDWIRADAPQAQSWLLPLERSAVLEVVNGVAIIVGTSRWVLMPSEGIDESEFAVPQEWVDIPDWASDYYLAVQMKLESGWLRIWGYATHQEFKTLGTYDASDRTYSLEADQVTQDLNAFWVTSHFCAAEQTQAAIPPLPELAPAQAATLIQRLGNPAVVFPRLAVPFPLWAALLAEESWRHQLWQHRIGSTTASDALVRLSDWLQGTFTAAWQAIDAVLSPQQTGTVWRNDAAAQPTAFEVSRVKALELGDQPGSEQIALVIGMTSTVASQVLIGLQICPTGNQLLLPRPIQVRLLDATGQELGQASAAVTEIIQLQFAGYAGERFQVEVISGDRQVIEEFEI